MKKIKIAISLDDKIVNRWQNKIIDHLLQLEFLDIETIINFKLNRKPKRKFLESIILNFEKLFF